jgi:hypothetical protein|nr:MAG TPA: hypothetical protein [Caudoviricetes sp.]
MEAEITTAILAKRTAKRARQLADSALNTLARRAQWKLCEIEEPDFKLFVSDDEKDIVVMTDFHGETGRIPVEEADPQTIAKLAMELMVR